MSHDPGRGRGATAVALSMVATLALAGCGSSAKPTSTPATTAPPPATTAKAGAPATTATTPATTAAPATTATSCTVITQSEAGAALGQAVRPPVQGHATVEGGVACVFYGPSVPVGTDPDDPVSDSVRVVLVTGQDAVKYFDNYRASVSAQAIPGLGDEAYYDGYASLSVLKGDEYLRVAVIGVAKILPAEEALAVDALPRM